MSITLNASTSSGFVQSADNSGEIELQSNGTTALKVNTNEGIQILNCLGVGNATPSTSGAGITFPATQSASSDANTLDDYEEGTWTPTLTGSSSNPTVSYTTQTGTYTKIGNLVTVSCDIVPSSYSGGSGNLRIGGLPFTSASSPTRAVGTAYLDGVDIVANKTWAVTYIQPSVAYIRLLSCQNNAVAGDVIVSGVSANDNLILQITYFV